MKKFTALMLVVLMVVSLVPFGASAATTWTKVDTAEEFAAMTNGNYWLTADIDLSKVTWKTIAEFSGTLNGNGKTVTVPKDAPIFDKLSGTVKNVNLKGTMTLDDADVSETKFQKDQNTQPLGVLANYAFGATIENVHTAAEVTYTSARTAMPSLGVAFGGLVGVTLASYKVETKTVEGAEVKELVFVNNTTIKNVSNTGKVTVSLPKGFSMNRDQLGGLVGASFGNVDISLALVSATLSTTNGCGNDGGIVGYIHGRYPQVDTGTTASWVETEAMAVTMTDCLWNGTYTHSGDKNERFAGMAGYAHNVVMKNCVNEGSASSEAGKSCAGLLGYGNCGSDNGVHWVLVENSVALGPKGCGTWTSVKAAKSSDTKFGHLEYKNIPLLKDNKLNGYTGDTAKGQVDTNVVTKETKEEVRAAFLANGATNFELKDGVLSLKMPAFTPSADPSDTPAPTGDMTVALVATALVSLAAVTVIAKKKVTE